MKPLLIISGPTATGKTDLAIKLAQELNGELINADSRQIYRSLDIGTGKDHPQDTLIHLVDIINPDQSFSAAQYRQLALEKINEIHNKNKLPILVGGSGQYIDAVINPQPTFAIKPNQFLRFILNKFPLKLLQLILRFVDFQTFNSLNRSDSANPHRLIRKIEIKLSSSMKNDKWLNEKFCILHLSLIAPHQFLYDRIDQRVQKRLNLGLIDEIKKILKTYHWSDPGLNTLAYKEFKTGFNSKNITTWRFDEHGYARRQLTWFKKSGAILVDITAKNFIPTVFSLVKKWYNQPYETTKS